VQAEAHADLVDEYKRRQFEIGQCQCGDPEDPSPRVKGKVKYLVEVKLDGGDWQSKSASVFPKLEY
jgi:hypothetical protein